MQRSPVTPSSRPGWRCIADLGTLCLFAALTATCPLRALRAQTEPAFGVRPAPLPHFPDRTAPVTLEIPVYVARTGQCAPILHTDSWRVDLVCLDGLPVWRIRGPFRGGESRSAPGILDTGWTHLTLRSDGVHTPELYLDGEDMRDLRPFSTWPAAWPDAGDFLRRYLDEHGVLASHLDGRVGQPRITWNVPVIPTRATLAFDSTAAEELAAGVKQMDLDHEHDRRGLLLQLGIVVSALLTVGAAVFCWFVVAQPGVERA